MDDRNAEYPISSLFLERWSPRAFDGSSLPLETLLTLLEAARWAPSSFNAQPWRFYHALRETGGFDRILQLLIPANRDWAQHASALLVVASESIRAGPDGPQPWPTHAFDAGAAWACLALQSGMLGLHAHAMAGFDRCRAKIELHMPDAFEPQAVIAVGRRGSPEQLPEKLRAREFASGRKPLAEIAFAV